MIRTEPNYVEIADAIHELDEQIAGLQKAKGDMFKVVRDDFGKKVCDELKLAIKLARMDDAKRMERDDIEEGAFRILAILQKPRAPRATHARVENIEQFDAETGELVVQRSGSSSEVRTGFSSFSPDAGKTEAATSTSAENVSDEISASNPEIDVPPCVDTPDDGASPQAQSSGIHSEPSADDSSRARAGQPDEAIAPPVASSGTHQPTPHVLTADSGQPRIPSSDALGAKSDGVAAPFVGSVGDKPLAFDHQSEQATPHSREGCQKPDACRVAKFSTSILCASCASERQKARAA